MKFIAVGANLPSSRYGPPKATCEAALRELEGEGVAVLRVAPWYRSAPVPMSDQPWYVNSVAEIETGLPPHDVLKCLHRVESRIGRVRTVRDAPRIVDLDLLCYDDYLSARAVRAPLAGASGEGGFSHDGREDDGRENGEEMIVPHPRMHERAFVLLPLRDLAPTWRHPRSGRGIDALIAALPREQVIVPLDERAAL